MQGLAAVPGLRVGHATDPVARTGCTVILGPFRAACDARGMATGTRELEALSPLHVAPRADALLLTGGSAFGLAAATGVVEWLEERATGSTPRRTRTHRARRRHLRPRVGSDRNPTPRWAPPVRPPTTASPKAPSATPARPSASSSANTPCPAGSAPGRPRTRVTAGALAVVNAAGDVLDDRATSSPGLGTVTASSSTSPGDRRRLASARYDPHGRQYRDQHHPRRRRH